MVESALEFLDVCEDENYRNVIFSMKSSNPQVAIQAYRLLVARLTERAPGEPSYPLHVGVTEAGDGEDGRIKSAIGIGSLLEDGIGDTIRVSLTEDPVKEVPVAAALARRAQDGWRRDRAEGGALSSEGSFVDDPYAYTRRVTQVASAGGLEIGGSEVVRVELELERDFDSALAPKLATAHALAPDLACEGLRVELTDVASLDRVSELARQLAELDLDIPIAASVAPGRLQSNREEWTKSLVEAGVVRLVIELKADGGLGLEGSEREGHRRTRPTAAELASGAAIAVAAGLALEWSLEGVPRQVAPLIAAALAATHDAGAVGAVLSLSSPRLTHAVRVAVAELRSSGAGDIPLILRHTGASLQGGDALLGAAVDLGGLLCDGIGDAICLPVGHDPGSTLDLAYRILQGSRQRTTRTEYISCPSCGRTLFDLEETTARVKARTEHLKGVKIAVMGCIVNGPGEMADADFGYVGAGTARVNLYAGKEVVARGVSEDVAPDRLVEIIREYGAWRDPS
jgi:(E)-4-hydroxy-3-methylbut-2-enyl-diphosphate synthase